MVNTLKSLYLVVIIVVFNLLILMKGKEIQVPLIKSPEHLVIKSGTHKVLNQPQFDFQRVYRRSARQRIGPDFLRFPPCMQNKAEIQLDVYDQILLEGVPKRPQIISDFQDIEYSQFLLDILYDDSIIYVMFKNFRVAVIKLQNDKRINSLFMIEVLGITSSKFLQVGYFVKLGNDILFVNPSYTIKVTQKSALVLYSYGRIYDFQTVFAIDDTHFAVAENSFGIRIFQYNGTNVMQSIIYDASKLDPETKNLYLQDALYWKQQQTLITLDLFHGIRTYKLSKLNGTFQLAPSQPISQVKNCKLMYLYKDNLYVYCESVYNFKLNSWPKIEQAYLMFPNIEVKQIYEIDDIIAFVGRNSFSLLYLDRIVNNYQEKNLDKIIFFKDMFANADETGIAIGKIDLIKPYISCYSQDPEYLKPTTVIFKTKAQCNDGFFKKYNINKTTLGQINQDDICIYQIQKTVTFWEGGQFKTLPFFIATIVLASVGIVVLVLYLLKKMRLKKYIQMIEEYSQQAVGDSAKQQYIQQDVDAVGSNKALQSDENLNKQQNQSKDSQLRYEPKNKTGELNNSQSVDVQKPGQIQMTQKKDEKKKQIQDQS